MSGSLTIVGLGPGRPEQVTLEAAQLLEAAADAPNARVYGFSNVAPLATAVAPRLSVQPLDGLLVAAAGDRQRGYQGVVQHLLTEAYRDGGDVYYVVAGNPLVINDLVLVIRRTCKLYQKPVRVVAGLSFFDLVLDRVFWRADPGVQLLSAWAVARGEPVLVATAPALLYELGEMSAADGAAGTGSDEATMLETLASRLLALYPPEHPVALLFSSGPPDFESRSTGVELAALAAQAIPPLSNLWVPALGGPAMESELAG